jgi:lactate dehydrogenase-like 2-hydroxyacid dehydrogenase
MKVQPVTTEIFFKIDAPVYKAHVEPLWPVHQGDPQLSTLRDDLAATIRVVVTNGVVGMTGAEMARFPTLELICAVGTGYETIDVAAARDRGIRVTHAAGTNAVAVAEHAVALLLAAVRNIPGYDASAKGGTWRGDISPRPIVNGKKLGILGMGDIGQRIARSAAAFDMPVSYVATAPKPHLPYAFKATVMELAETVDFLICAVPGGVETRHMINADVLRALGPGGYLVNVGRGSVVDTNALIDALNTRTLAGAALDVFEDEPEIPEALRRLRNVVLTPHIAGIAPEVQQLSAVLLGKNIRAFLAGEPLVSPVPA